MKNLTFKIENGKWQVANFGTALAIVTAKYEMKLSDTFSYFKRTKLLFGGTSLRREGDRLLFCCFYRKVYFVPKIIYNNKAFRTVESSRREPSNVVKP